jgi:hypothetical protein
MVRWMLSLAIGCVWTVAVVLWTVIFSAAGSWFAQTALMAVLFVLLISGIVLLLVGMRDLVRDFRHYLDMRTHKNDGMRLRP